MALLLAGPTGGPEHAQPGHPERPERLAAVIEGVASLHLGADLVTLDYGDVDDVDLLRVHDAAYVRQVEALCRDGGGQLDPDTYATVNTYGAARRAAGAGMAAIEAVSATGDVAFVAGRPPGHHALSARAMGFCVFNNIAIAAAALAERGERVAIIDWDVHHGNGTQDIFWEDPRVLYASTHQHPLYPGTGAFEETGGAAAPGTTVNVPLPPGATGDVVLSAIEEVIVPAVERFGPTWVLVSAGFDAHRDDPLAELRCTDGDFARFTRCVLAMAPRRALFLEGGYDLGALRSSVAATLGAVMGADVATTPPSSGGPGLPWVERARRLHDPH
jgi:acetoin utilization deacetylase AcuC-like enzyme